VSVDREPSVLGKKEDETSEQSSDRSDTEIDDRSETLFDESGENGERDRSDTEIDESADRSDTELDQPAKPSEPELELDQPAKPSEPELDEPGAEREVASAPTKSSTSDSARPAPAPATRAGPTYHVAGFWRRLGGGLIDLAVVLPVSLVLGWLAGAVSGIHLPESRHRGIDFWLDLFLANDPAFVGWLGLAVVVGCVYLMVFQTVMGRTLGMRATKTRIIDLYGDPPTVPRAGIRTGGYLVGLATLGLGFIWIGFDSEKRGVQDWIASTYVIKD
jgi:uncharacterized RDD family membrane protein YckC